MNKIISRKEEQEILERFLKSNKAEFLAIYGRRRVGKTFLIHSYFSQKKCIYFHATGIRDGLIKVFIASTKTEKQIFFSMITSSGLKPNMYSEELIASSVSLEDLF